MARHYDLVLFGPDQPALWMAALHAAGRNLRVALLLDPLPDPGLPAFVSLPQDPARVGPLCSALGIRPLPSPFPPYLPELQVIVAGRPLDFIADARFQETALERDLQERAAAFVEASEELIRLADGTLAEARDQNFPGLAPLPEKGLLRKFQKPRAWQPPPSPGFHAWAGKLAPAERAILAAGAVAWLGFPLPAEPELLQVALCWRLCRGLHHGGGDEADLRASAAAQVARRGAVIEAGLEAVTRKGEDGHTLRLRGGTVIEAGNLMGPSDLLDRLFGERREAGPLSAKKTFFLKFDRDGIPDTLAGRALVVADPDKPVMGDNLFLLGRAPRAQRRETLAVTMFHPPAHVHGKDLPKLLAAALPWLNPRHLEPDDTREPQVSLFRPPRSFQREPARAPMPFANLHPLPSEALPSWGPWGALLSLGQVEFK